MKIVYSSNTSSGMTYIRVPRSNELYHHGILGQRWGVRRFQNKDGSLTSAGKKRYNIKSSSERRRFDFKENYMTPTSSDSHDSGITSMDVLHLVNVGVHAVETVKLLPIAAAGAVGFFPPMVGVAAAAAAIGGTVIVGREISGNIKAVTRTQQYKHEKAAESKDPRTGFHLKNKDLSDREDIRRVNPGYSNSLQNSKNNCMLCSMTYELRKRGFDVSAKKATSGYTVADIDRWFKGKVNHQSSNTYDNLTADYRKNFAKLSITHSLYNKEKRKEIAESAIEGMKKQGNGARGIIGMNWNCAPKAGHALHYEVKNGSVIISDAQTGKIYEDPHKILDKACLVSYSRVDNLQIDEDAIREVAE